MTGDGTTTKHPALHEVPRLLGLLGMGDEETMCVVRLMGPRNDRRTVQTFVRADAAAGLCADDASDCYLGAAVFRAGAERRVAGSIERLTALVADLDYKPDGVVDADGAKQVVEDVSQALRHWPGVRVHTGHGEQVYWLLDDGEDVTSATVLLARFGLLVRAVAEEHELHVDNVFTPERIWRAPGTRNHKGDPVRVVIADADEEAERIPLARLAEELDLAGVPDLTPGDTEREVIAPPAEWPTAERTCPYVSAMVRGWVADRPAERNPWMYSQAVRLCTALRMGCITGEDAALAAELLRKRFRMLLADSEHYTARAERRDEVSGALVRARDLVSTKTEAECWTELGGTAHGHVTGEAGDDGEDQDQEKPRRKPLAVRMFELVERDHVLFLGDDGRAYAVRKEGGHRAEQVTSSFVMNACWSLGQTASYATAARSTAEVLRARAVMGPRITLSLRCARWGEHALVLDLGEPDSARCVVVTWKGWEVHETPPEGVLFRRSTATRPLPEPVHAGDGHAVLRELLSMDAADDRRWLLVRGWLAAALLPDIPRPLLVWVGPAGSAKTTRAAMTVGLIDPKPEHLLGSSFGRDAEDDQVKALANYAVGYDNLGRVSEAVSDHLARLVTGEAAERRKRYTDDELAAVNYRRTGVFTSVVMPTVQPDAMARLIPIECTRVPEELRLAERRLWPRWNDAHDRMLGAVLDDVVTMLRRLPEVQADDGLALPRMADYWQALHAVDPELATAYTGAVEDAMRTAAETDPFVMTVVEWLAAEKGHTWEGTPTSAWEAAGGYRFHADREGVFGVSARWWPRSAHAFSSALSRTAEPLAAVGVTVTPHRTGKRRTIVLTYCGSEER